MAHRPNGSAPFSLFAFQDIITSVTGIMVLVTLTLALELLQRKEDSPPQKTAEIVADLRSAVTANEAEIDELRRKVAASQSAIEKVAGIDATSARSELQELEQLNSRLQSEVADFARQRQEARRRQQAAQEVKERRAAEPQTLDELVAEAEEKRRQIEELKRSNRTIFNPSRDASKTPWLVEVTGEQMVVAPWGQSAPPRTVRSAADLKQLASGRDPNAEYFVLLVKPDGIDMFDLARHALQSEGFDIGFDLLTEDQAAIDPQTGAAMP